MAIIGDRYVVADDLSLGWLDAVRCAQAFRERKLVHLVVRILRPHQETAVVRDAAQQLIDERSALKSVRAIPHIETVRNTIFPAAWARRSSSPEELADHYRAQYERSSLCGFRGNSRGTYFGRIVAYPRAKGGHADQLNDTIRKFREELQGHGPKSSRYEINIYSELKDRSPMGFPCLAHLSLHLHHGQLHMQAIYRNEQLVRRAYGNYLGLAELLQYIALTVGVDVGELLVTVGHAELDAPLRVIEALLSKVDAALSEA